MKYSLRAILLLAIALTSIVEARKTECVCGNLGSGVNPCRCNEIVVKAAKIQKPLFYASPEAINQAAAAREASRKLSTGTCGGTYSTSTSTGSSMSSASSSSISSSASSIGNFEKPIGNFHYPIHPISDGLTLNSDCGCGKKSIPESLEVHDLLSHNVHGKIVPSFSPVGDLCYPSSHSSDKYQITTKVTPAYPGKIKCSPPIPYEICLKVLNGQIDEAGLRKLGQTIMHGDVSAVDRYRLLNGLTGENLSDNSNNLDRYISNNVDSIVDRYNSVKGYGNFRRYNSQHDNLAGFGSYENSNTGSLGATHGTYSNNFATSNNIALIQGLTGSYKSNCGTDFGDNPEFPEDYSYPRLPADPVSLTLAYKNLFPRTVIHNSKEFVPEDKLAFGHRTVPIESMSSKKIQDIPEEKLQILDKPVVELKPMLPTPITLGIYNEQEEAKLAELEAIERERINQEEIAEQPQQHLITYGDLGYVPINGALPSGSMKAETHPTVNMFNAEDSEAGCGPLGPPVPGYIPGNVVIDRELIETESAIEDNIHSKDSEEIYVRNYNEISEEDESDSLTSGIYARLNSVARKYNPTCLQ